MRYFRIAAWNDWRHASFRSFDITFVRINIDVTPGAWVALDVVFLGIGAGITWYPGGVQV